MTTTMREFVSRHGIRASARWADSNPNIEPSEWDRDASHWRVTIRHDGRQLIVPYSQGAAHTGEPSVLDVLDCLASDATGYENARSF